MKVLIAGGGTGGHLYMGIALARELQARDPSCDFLFVGTRRGLESRIVPREGFRLEYIVSAGLKGMRMRSLIRHLLMIPRSLWQSGRLVSHYAPDAVVGVGGYSSGPVVLAAWWRGKPTLVLEPNAYPGLTNRWLARVVDRAAVALPEASSFFRGKAAVTGIPVRTEFSRIAAKAAGDRFTVLIYGGSQGSHALNAIVTASLPELKEFTPGLALIHQTGEKDFETVRDAYRAVGFEADVRSFLPEIYAEFARADLIISRAGASTVAEITAAGRAAILVPFPGAADDHQTKNALALQKLGAARMIPERDWKPGRLVLEVRHFMSHRGELVAMAEAARKAARPDATQRIADLVQSLIPSARAGKPESHDSRMS
jgi:UDP-N-acetylglucosamine--N-acetylmuramyl-(pentapeptide) pyrophosphoryl-undecaprenol N-acetylglucosamine transferase